MPQPALVEESIPVTSKPPRRPNAAERLRRADKLVPSDEPADSSLAAESRAAPPESRRPPQSGDAEPKDESGPARSGFTLVEILVAMAVTLIMLGIVVTIFGLIGDNVTKARSEMEMNEQLRGAKNKLQLDLIGVTARMLPPLRPEDGLGYFEIIEGPVGRLPPNTTWVPDETGTSAPDTTVGDTDDILMFTTRTRNEPFVGRHPGFSALQSQVAEVAWFLRGTTLYRRQLLVRPDLNTSGGVGATRVPQPTAAGVLYPFGGANPNFYAQCDLSVHAEGTPYDLSPSPPGYKVVANSLADLTKREYRFAHAPLNANLGTPFGWPHDLRGWGFFYEAQPYGYAPPISSATLPVLPILGRLGLPTLGECSSANWYYPGVVDLTDPTNGQQVALLDQNGKGAASGNAGTEQYDAWDNPNPWQAVISPSSTTPKTTALNSATGTLNYFYPGSREGEDVILTNVLSFDVRVWDATAYVLAYTTGGVTTVISPGDADYPKSVVNYVTGTTGYTIVSRGAYVDLNYYAGIAAYATANGVDLSTYSANLQTLFPCTQTTPPTEYYLYGMYGLPNSFAGPGNANSHLDALLRYTSGAYQPDSSSHYIVAPAIYDTGSFHYERDGIDQDGDGIVDPGTDGIDNNANGLVDELTEREAPPPYTTPLRGVQVKIRCFEPDSRVIREVTIVQEFVPE